MHEVVRAIFLVSAYWLSLVLAGCGTLLLLKRYVSAAYLSIRNAIDYALGQPLAGLLFMSFAFEAALLGFVSLFFYLFHLSVGLFVGTYMLLGIVGWGYLVFFFCKHLFSRRHINIFNPNGEMLVTKLLFIVLCALIGLDFAFSIYAGADVLNGSDAYVHLARMVSILHQNFGIQDGFLSGVDETRYHFNAIYALFVVPSQLFHIAPAEVWRYSFAFLRLLQWLAIFTLAWHACVNWLNQKRYAFAGATIATIFAIGYYSSTFFVATYPNQIVTLWFVLLIMGISFYEGRRRSSAVPALMAALLITLTHPTYALKAVIFIVLTVAIRIVFDRRHFVKDKQPALFYAKVLAILVASPLLTFFLPNRMMSVSYNYGDFSVTKVAGLAIFKPYNFFKDTPLQFFLLFCGTLGLLYLLYRLWPKKQQRALVLALIVFYPLLVYEPLGFGILRSQLPLWLIQRFNYMDVLNYIAIPLGLLALVDISRRVATRVRPQLKLIDSRAAYLVLAIIMMALSVRFMIPGHRALTVNRLENNHYYAFIAQTYEDFHTVMQNNDLIVANVDDSYFLPAVLPVKTIAIYPAHATPMADEKNRLSCQTFLMQHFDYSDLVAVGANEVVISRYAADYETQIETANSKSYLRQVAANQDFVVYKFVHSKSTGRRLAPYLSCVRYQKVESS